MVNVCSLTLFCCWKVLLVYKGKGFCGGVIFKPSWILTASHCLENSDSRFLKVVAGTNTSAAARPPRSSDDTTQRFPFSHQSLTQLTSFILPCCLSGEHNIVVNESTEQLIQVAEIIMHENYTMDTANNDIALLRLATPIVYSQYAVPICLPTQLMAERELWSIDLHTVSGWGRRSENGPTSNLLRRTKVPRMRTQTCVEESGVQVTKNMFCAGYLDGQTDSCKGDSGGPLVTQYKQTAFLLGIVSWGKGCARPGNYGIYTRVSNYLEWIHDRTVAPVQPQNSSDGADHNLTT